MDIKCSDKEEVKIKWAMDAYKALINRIKMNLSQIKELKEKISNGQDLEDADLRKISEEDDLKKDLVGATLDIFLPPRLKVMVPDGSKPGDTFLVDVREGEQVEVKVPPKGEPGMVIDVALPKAAWYSAHVERYDDSTKQHTVRYLNDNMSKEKDLVLADQEWKVALSQRMDIITNKYNECTLPLDNKFDCENENIQNCDEDRKFCNKYFYPELSNSKNFKIGDIVQITNKNKLGPALGSRKIFSQKTYHKYIGVLENKLNKNQWRIKINIDPEPGYIFLQATPDEFKKVTFKKCRRKGKTYRCRKTAFTGTNKCLNQDYANDIYSEWIKTSYKELAGKKLNRLITEQQQTIEKAEDKQRYLDWADPGRPGRVVQLPPEGRKRTKRYKPPPLTRKAQEEADQQKRENEAFLYIGLPPMEDAGPSSEPTALASTRSEVREEEYKPLTRSDGKSIYFYGQDDYDRGGSKRRKRTKRVIQKNHIIQTKRNKRKRQKNQKKRTKRIR